MTPDLVTVGLYGSPCPPRQLKLHANGEKLIRS
jgi:hypothetical protein